MGLEMVEGLRNVIRVLVQKMPLVTNMREKRFKSKEWLVINQLITFFSILDVLCEWIGKRWISEEVVEGGMREGLKQAKLVSEGKRVIELIIRLMI